MWTASPALTLHIFPHSSYLHCKGYLPQRDSSYSPPSLFPLPFREGDPFASLIAKHVLYACPPFFSTFSCLLPIFYVHHVLASFLYYLFPIQGSLSFLSRRFLPLLRFSKPPLYHCLHNPFIPQPHHVAHPPQDYLLDLLPERSYAQLIPHILHVYTFPLHPPQRGLMLVAPDAAPEGSSDLSTTVAFPRRAPTKCSLKS